MGTLPPGAAAYKRADRDKGRARIVCTAGDFVPLATGGSRLPPLLQQKRPL